MRGGVFEGDFGGIGEGWVRGDGGADEGEAEDAVDSLLLVEL